MNRLGQIKETDQAPALGIQRGEHKRPLRSRGISVLAGIVLTVVVLAGCSHNQADKNQVASHEEYDKGNPAAAKTNHHASVPGSDAEVKSRFPPYNAAELNTTKERAVYFNDTALKMADEVATVMLDNYSDVKEKDTILELNKNGADITYMYGESKSGLIIMAKPNVHKVDAVAFSFKEYVDLDPGTYSKEDMRHIVEVTQLPHSGGWLEVKAMTTFTDAGPNPDGLTFSGSEGKVVELQTSKDYRHQNLKPIGSRGMYDKATKAQSILSETIAKMQE